MSDAENKETAEGNPYGYNPISRRYVKRTGAAWIRLVKSGIVKDPEIMEQLNSPALMRQKVKKIQIAAPDPDTTECREKAKAVGVARKEAKKLIAEHVDMLEGLPPDEVQEILKKMLSMRVVEPEKKPAAPKNLWARRETKALQLNPARPRYNVKVSDLFTDTETENESTTEYDE